MRECTPESGHGHSVGTLWGWVNVFIATLEFSMAVEMYLVFIFFSTVFLKTVSENIVHLPLGIHSVR
jgi:hypothetical protein